MDELSYAEERDMDDRSEAHLDRLAEEADERDRLGFEVGDRVTVGKGTKVWVVDSFFGGYPDGAPLVRLEPVEGYSATSVEVTRLVRVEEA